MFIFYEPSCADSSLPTPLLGSCLFFTSHLEVHPTPHTAILAHVFILRAKMNIIIAIKLIHQLLYSYTKRPAIASLHIIYFQH